MAKPPELWAFVLANLGLFVVSSLLTLLTFVAYRQDNGQASYLIATSGFGFLVLGGLLAPMYELGVRGDYHLIGTELLWLQAGESILLMGGLGLLFYAITHHETGSSATEEDPYKLGPQETDD